MRGFTTPTPIQRAALPAILASPPRDLVGMARTGSGKTLAYMVPLIQRLNTAHSASFGARALILVPTRELAMQVLLVGKDIARGAKEGTGEPLRWAMIVGGDSLEDQFSLVASNPDVCVCHRRCG
jgi:ATP-dependent RNA helicase DDX54/DBP10